MMCKLVDNVAWQIHEFLPSKRKHLKLGIAAAICEVEAQIGSNQLSGMQVPAAAAAAGHCVSREPGRGPEAAADWRLLREGALSPMETHTPDKELPVGACCPAWLATN